MLLCTNMGFTLICAWSLAEAARYLETYKAYENKGAKIIKVHVCLVYYEPTHDGRSHTHTTHSTTTSQRNNRSKCRAAIRTRCCRIV